MVQGGCFAWAWKIGWDAMIRMSSLATSKAEYAMVPLTYIDVRNSCAADLRSAGGFVWQLNWRSPG